MTYYDNEEKRKIKGSEYSRVTDVIIIQHTVCFCNIIIYTSAPLIVKLCNAVKIPAEKIWQEYLEKK